MSSDESAIREWIKTWLDAAKVGDVERMLPLLADDVIFMVPGLEPFGKQAWESGQRHLKGSKLEADSEVLEVTVAGDWAWCRTKLSVTVTPPGGRRSGYTLSVFRRTPDGRWQLARDANLLSEDKG